MYHESGKLAMFNDVIARKIPGCKVETFGGGELCI